MSNRDQDLIQLELLDLESRQSQLVEVDPENQVDFGGAVFSEATDELIATYYAGERQRIYPQNEQLATDLAFLQQRLPQAEISLNSLTQDDRLAIVKVQSDVNPGAAYLFDRKAQTLEKLYDSRPELPSQHLAVMQPIRYIARDGLEIPAYLTLPQGLEPGYRHAPWWTLVPRYVGIQPIYPVSRQSWLRGSPTQLSRFHRLRQSLSQGWQP